MCKGFKQISNDFFESDYWRQSRTYNDCEALLDIISQVRFEASEHSARIGGREVIWGQAQWPASVRFLAARWHWTEWKVRTFLSGLKRKGVIETADDQGVNMITLKKYLIFKTEESHTPTHTPFHTLNELNINELVNNITQKAIQQVTQRITRDSGASHTTHTKQNNGNNNSSSLRSELALFTCETGSDELSEFSVWLSTNCPYISSHLKPMTAREFHNLKVQYGQPMMRDICENIENRIDLRKKYSNLYRTLLNWLKREKNENTRKRNINSAAVSPTNEKLVSDTYDLINEARARESLSDSI